MDLATTYLGLSLRTPLVASTSPLTQLDSHAAVSHFGKTWCQRVGTGAYSIGPVDWFSAGGLKPWCSTQRTAWLRM